MISTYYEIRISGNISQGNSFKLVRIVTILFGNDLVNQSAVRT